MIVSVSMICSPNKADVTSYLINKADYLHFDLMDNTLCDCKGINWDSIDFNDSADLQKYEMHIISTNPRPFIDRCIKYNCGCIVFHVESNVNISEEISRIRKHGIRVGLAISIDTPLEKIEPYLAFVDLVLVMTVKLGPPGQVFQKCELNKVVQLKKYKNRAAYHYQIEVDGSCNESHYKDIYNSGAEICVVGNSGLFSLSPNIETAWRKMEQYMCLKQTIYVHADYVGSQLMEFVIEWLIQKGYTVVILYTDGTEEYPECARKLSGFVIASDNNFGVLCCGTGIGMSMVANKVSGIRAAVVSEVYSAIMSREHNDANVLCLGSRVVTKEKAAMILDAFFSTRFLFGKHTPRVDRYELSQ